MRALEGSWVMELVVGLLSASVAAAAVQAGGRVGLSARSSAIAMSVAGAAGFALSRGTARTVFAGVLAAGVAQLVSGWFAQLDKRIETPTERVAECDHAPASRRARPNGATLESV